MVMVLWIVLVVLVYMCGCSIGSFMFVDCSMCMVCVMDGWLLWLGWVYYSFIISVCFICLCFFFFFILLLFLLFFFFISFSFLFIVLVMVFLLYSCYIYLISMNSLLLLLGFFMGCWFVMSFSSMMLKL